MNWNQHLPLLEKGYRIPRPGAGGTEELQVFEPMAQVPTAAAQAPLKICPQESTGHMKTALKIGVVELGQDRDLLAAALHHLTHDRPPSAL